MHEMKFLCGMVTVQYEKTTHEISTLFPMCKTHRILNVARLRVKIGVETYSCHWIVIRSDTDALTLHLSYNAFCALWDNRLTKEWVETSPLSVEFYNDKTICFAQGRG